MMQPYFLDGIIVVIFVIGIIDGRRRGFVKILLTIIAMVISSLIAATLADPIAAFVAENFVHESFVDGISLSLTDAISSGADNIAEALPEYIISAVNSFNPDLLSNLGSSVNTVELAETIYSAIENTLIINILFALAFIVVYFVSSLVLGIAVSFIDKIFKFPGLNAINKFLGGFLGGIKGMIFDVIICVLLYAVSTAFPQGELSAALEETTIINTIIQTVSNAF